MVTMWGLALFLSIYVSIHVCVCVCTWSCTHTACCISMHVHSVTHRHTRAQHSVPDGARTVYTCGTEENKAKCAELDAPRAEAGWRAQPQGQAVTLPPPAFQPGSPPGR